MISKATVPVVGSRPAAPGRRLARLLRWLPWPAARRRVSTIDDLPDSVLRDLNLQDELLRRAEARRAERIRLP